MKFSIFKTAKAQRGELCIYEKYLETATSQSLMDLCERIAAEEDADKRGELKKGLPAITWQAYFPGRRLAKEAEPSGLFMLDIDHVEDPYALYSGKVAKRIKELGIVYVGKTASCKGLRIVAKCRKGLNTLEECQRWLASNLKVEYDGVCKDFARCSFLVHDSYTYYMDAKSIWQDEPEEGTVYAVAGQQASLPIVEEKTEEPEPEEQEAVMETYKGLNYGEIAKEWLILNGGEPEKGERNAKLYKLALRLRYITDFNEGLLVRIMPRYGLPLEEIKQLVHSANNAIRASSIPSDLQTVLDNLQKRSELGDPDELPEIITDTEKLPPLPPVIKEMAEVAPQDFKQAVILCQLPILGTLGSRLRAEYLDGRIHEPSFQVSLEAPQASGKSFMSRLAEYELASIIEHDQVEREKEQEYDKKVRELKLLNVKVNVNNKDEILGSRPQSLIRYLSPKISITKLLMRLSAAQGLHLFAMATEIDTVTKAFKSGFSSYSDLLRNAFDSDYYGQDYASENSFSGIVRVRYNVLFSGTPKAMRRFYPDVEDGLVSRVCFVALPDQFGKPMPIWGELTKEQKAIVDVGLVRLNEISIQGNDVQEEHVMRLFFLNREIEKWIHAQQREALKDEDRTRDIFCRRAAVVGFRAGMLAYFLWGEKNTPTIRRNVVKFATWVANCMLNQHLLRFNVQGTGSNTNRWEEAFNRLPEVFTRDDVRRELNATNSPTPAKNVLYQWRLAHMIEVVSKEKSEHGHPTATKFKKIKQ